MAAWCEASLKNNKKNILDLDKLSWRGLFALTKFMIWTIYTYVFVLPSFSYTKFCVFIIFINIKP